MGFPARLLVERDKSKIVVYQRPMILVAAVPLVVLPTREEQMVTGDHRASVNPKRLDDWLYWMHWLAREDPDALLAALSMMFARAILFVASRHAFSLRPCQRL
jgi:hypothetical protein